MNPCDDVTIASNWYNKAGEALPQCPFLTVVVVVCCCYIYIYLAVQCYFKKIEFNFDVQPDILYVHYNIDRSNNLQAPNSTCRLIKNIIFESIGHEELFLPSVQKLLINNSNIVILITCVFKNLSSANQWSMLY